MTNNTATSLRYRELIAQPQTLLLACYVLAYLLTWSLAPLLWHWSIPDDNLEQLAWVLHPDWGYNKHPPFPTWVLWVFERALPHSVPLTYLLGSLQVAAMLFFAWRITAELMDQRRALVVVLFISCMTFYTGRLYFYNHNTALLVAHAAATYCVWRCANSGRAVWWVLLGLCWGAGMLSKYQMVLSIACNVGFLALLTRQPAWRAERLEFLKGVVLAGTICAAALLPHVVWLVRNDFPTFAYASHSMAADLPITHRPLSILGFLGNQVGRMTPVFVLSLLLLRLYGNKGPANIAGHDRASVDPAAARLLLQIHALGPFVLMTLLALLAGMELQMHWGTAFLWAFGPLYMLSARGRAFAELPLGKVLAGILLLQILTLAATFR